ncbi:hypothetical protein F2Q68_00038772 [Brassica cretica]|uniref:Uncharacterized protein n=1 Tax=Brassica cretica TaxID=69181 RepID=A0A8S9MGK4_BRACR|nr:hypothetical protein F2Q68_00038772 [Brassica cretica]
MTTLIDEIRSQRIANQAIANRLDQAERELAEHQAANIRERNQTLLDPLRTTSNPQSTGLFGTPEIPSSRSGRYAGENSQRPPPQDMTHRSISYSGLDVIDNGLQRPQSTPIQFQNGSTERASDSEIQPKGQSPNKQKRQGDRTRITELSPPSQDRSLPINQTAVPERTGARVWNRPGDRSSSEDLTRSQSRPISPTPLAQTRGELTELRGMMTTLIDEIRSQRIANQAITNRMDQAERELAEHRAASIRERNQTLLDPLRTTSNPQSTGLFGTPEIPSALSGRYVGENLQRPPPQGMTQRSLSYSGLDEIDTGLQHPRSTPIQFQNGLTERQGEPRTRISPPNHSIPENRTPSATRTFHQAGQQVASHDKLETINNGSKTWDTPTRDLCPCFPLLALILKLGYKRAIRTLSVLTLKRAAESYGP